MSLRCEGRAKSRGVWRSLSTGETAVPEFEAKGVARFRNLSNSKIQIPLGTIVETLGASSIRFRTTQGAEIAAGVGKTVDVPIEAIGAGASGNLDVDLIQAIEGPLGLSLVVTNPAPTSGGTERTVAAPSAEDRERVRTMLMENLRAEVQIEILTDLPAGSLIFPDSIRELAILDETYFPPAGQTGAALSLILRAKFSAEYASGDDLSALAALALNAALEDNFSAAPTASKFKIIGIPVTDADGKTNFQLQMERDIFRAIDTRSVLSLVQGRRIDSALMRA